MIFNKLYPLLEADDGLGGNGQGAADPVQPESTTEQVETTANEPVNAGSEEVATPQADEKPVQDAETNRMYAEMRRKAQAEAQAETQKAIDAEYARLYGKEYGIYSKADYDKAVAKQEREAQIQAEAEKQGISEDVARRLRDLEESNKATAAEKAEYERKLNLIKQDEQLKQDESFGEYYKEHTPEIKDLANKYGVDLETAMLLSIKFNFKNIVQGTAKKTQQETINNIIKNGTTTPGSMSSGGEEKALDYSTMSSADFKAAQEKALRGELRKS